MMLRSSSECRRLSATDAFFVAYQQRSGVLMQLGGEAEIEGKVGREDLQRMVDGVLQRWPHLGQTLRPGVVGLSWSGNSHSDRMLQISPRRNRDDEQQEAARWRNAPLDPFREPSFQALWISRENGGLLALRAHHAALDGESFFVVGAEALRILAQRETVDGTASAQSFIQGPTKLGQLVSRKQIRPRRLVTMWRYTRWLDHEARAERSAPLAMDTCDVGDTATSRQTLSGERFNQITREAAAAGISLTAWCAAAWMRAIHSWNSARGAAKNPLISLELPVSLRRTNNGGHRIVGNFISPLVVFADATLPLLEIARVLKTQMNQAIRKRAHLSMPVLSAPARFLPWKLFRRLAVSPKTTGFATSHFTWFAPETDLPAEVAQLSKGSLRIKSQLIYTPVCLHMGAALAIVASSKEAELFLTYRLNAMSRAAAEQLLAFYLVEVEPGSRSHVKTATR